MGLRTPSSHRITRPARGALLNWFSDAAAPRRDVLQQLLRDIGLGDLGDLLDYIRSRWPENEAAESVETLQAGAQEADRKRFETMESFEREPEIEAHVFLMALPDALFLQALDSAYKVSASAYHDYNNSPPDPNPYINHVFEQHGVPWRLEGDKWESVDAAPTPTVPSPATSTPVGTLVPDINDRNPFDVPWDELDLSSVRRFLASAGDETLHWEAKGTKVRGEHVAKATAGFANAEGGYLIIGAARQDDGTWLLDGVELNDEPAPWVTKSIRTTVVPNPEFRVKAWPLPTGRLVAVVQVQPSTGMLCMTGGLVHYRRDGETTPLTDGATLHQVSSAVLARSRRFPSHADDPVSSTPSPVSVAPSATTAPAPYELPLDDPETFLRVARQLIDDGKGAQLNVTLSAASEEVRKAMTDGDEQRLADALDRITDIAASTISFDPTSTAAARATEALHEAFDLGTALPGRQEGLTTAKVYVEVLARARALGALAIRLRHGSVLRPLILHEVEGERLWPSWFRHGDIWASRGGLYSAGPNLLEGSRTPLRLAAEHAMRLPSLRPDGVTDEDALLTSICQFDLAINLVGAWAAQGIEPGDAVLPYFAAWDGDRVRPFAARVIDDVPCRSALLPDVDDADLAALLRFTAARSHVASQGLGSWAFWDGFEDGRVARFIAEHPQPAE